MLEDTCRLWSITVQVLECLSWYLKMWLSFLELWVTWTQDVRCCTRVQHQRYWKRRFLTLENWNDNARDACPVMENVLDITWACYGQYSSATYQFWNACWGTGALALECLRWCSRKRKSMLKYWTNAPVLWQSLMSALLSIDNTLDCCGDTYLRST